jgi:hypothetical protein
MNNTFILKEIVPILRNDVDLLRQKLVDTTEINKWGFKISSEAWANNNGVALGAVSCLAKPDDDAIELTIDVQQKGEIIKVWVGIYWSDGRLIHDIAEMEIYNKNIEEILLELEIFLEKNNQNALDTLLNFLKQWETGKN